MDILYFSIMAVVVVLMLSLHNKQTEKKEYSSSEINEIEIYSLNSHIIVVKGFPLFSFLQHRAEEEEEGGGFKGFCL